MWIPAVSPVKSTQWAAVKICWSSIKDPPQTWFNETSQGQAYFDQKGLWDLWIILKVTIPLIRIVETKLGTMWYWLFLTYSFSSKISVPPTIFSEMSPNHLDCPWLGAPQLSCTFDRWLVEEPKETFFDGDLF